VAQMSAAVHRLAVPRRDNTCRHIRTELGNGVLIVAMTGYGQVDDKDASARAGFDEHLTKPLIQLLQKLLRQCGPGRNDCKTNSTSSYRHDGATRSCPCDRR
jgi:DNA-binding response OmpR family regulator